MYFIINMLEVLQYQKLQPGEIFAMLAEESTVISTSGIVVYTWKLYPSLAGPKFAVGTDRKRPAGWAPDESSGMTSAGGF